MKRRSSRLNLIFALVNSASLHLDNGSRFRRTELTFS